MEIKLTGEVSWEFPVQQQQQERGGGSVWEVNVDADGVTFYYNTITQESQWDPPPELAQEQNFLTNSRTHDRYHVAQVDHLVPGLDQRKDDVVGNEQVLLVHNRKMRRLC